MRILPGYVRNINGITPTEAVSPVTPAEEKRIELGLMRVTPAQLALASTIQLRVLPVHEKEMPKLTIKEHNRMSEFAKWFLTLGRAMSIVVDTEEIDKLECSRLGGYFSGKVPMKWHDTWYEEGLIRSNPLIRATLQLDATATIPEYDDISVRMHAKNLMLSAPNSLLEKSGQQGFNMVYLEEI